MIKIKKLTEANKPKRVSGGVFSIKQNKWLSEPIQQDIPDIDKVAFEKDFNRWKDRYLEIINNIDELDTESNIEKIDILLDDIHNYRSKGLSTGGEFSIENLVFKEFRNLNYLQNLKDLKTKETERKLSLMSDNNDLMLESKINEDWNKRNQELITTYRYLAGLTTDEEITKANLDESALIDTCAKFMEDFNNAKNIILNSKER